MYYKRMSLKAAFVTAIGLVGSYVAGLVVGLPNLVVDLLPLTGTVSLAFWLPLIGEIKTNRAILNDSIFRDKSVSEVMSVANKYAVDYNKFEAQLQAKNASKKEESRGL